MNNLKENVMAAYLSINIDLSDLFRLESLKEQEANSLNLLQ